MRHLFVIDPIERLDPEKDTTIAFLREADRRGHELAVCTIDTLELGPDGRPRAEAIPARTVDPVSGGPWYEIGARRAAFLDEFDVVWMRKDPPFDMAFFYATHLLSMVAKTTLVVNDPLALRDANEKLFALRFPAVCPPARVSRRIAELLAFQEEMGGEMIVKPLDGAGGEGIFHLKAGDRNTSAILEAATAHESRYIMAQRYLPEIRQGDKRVILVEGEALGAVLRVPAEGESRANFHVGGQPAATEVDARDREIAAAVGPELVRLGIVFAGIDVIGGWLTEVNVTSPTGLREIADLGGPRLEVDVLDAVERRRNAG
ncbi:MAG: glutathione synthase [Acidobacteriota bacterium]|nr:glutathione synthase [Acidobacteriota bacterium]MDE3265130.1 glutathione synthase [Acidobacteriota bacterium]